MPVKTNPKVVGQNIKKFRKKKNYTLDELGSKLSSDLNGEDKGVGKSVIANWESGRNFPSVERLLHLTFILGVTIDDLFSESIKIQNNAFSSFELSISDIKIFKLSEKGHYSLLIKNNIESSYDSYSLKVETNNVWHLLENDVSKSLAEYDHSYLYLMFNHINEITNSNYDDIYLYSSHKPELVSLIKYDYSEHKFNFKMIINEEQVPKSSQYEGYPFEYYIENNYVMDSKQENAFIKKEDKIFNDFFTKALLNRNKTSKWLR